MIRFKDGGTSSCKPLGELNPQLGDTFLSADGTLLVFILLNDCMLWIRTDATRNPAFNHAAISGMLDHLSKYHTFKPVDIDFTIKAPTA